jgi:molybdopterin synthase catalytic subunit
MNLKILLFAALREKFGSSELDLLLPDGSTVADLRQALEQQQPRITSLLERCKIAVNQEFVAEDFRLHEADEIAVIPPVSGGSGLIQLTQEPIDYHALTEAVRSPHCGAVALFLGTVRDLTGEEVTVFLDYEAYSPMAEKKIAEIITEVRNRWPIGEIGIIHRLGRLGVGEISVAVAVSCPHRAEAFEACRFAIDTLKESVPIWKKDHSDFGASVWKEQ